MFDLFKKKLRKQTATKKGNVITLNGLLSNRKGPAKISLIEGKKIEEYFWKDGRHNPHGPAVVITNINGLRISEEYYINDRKSRKDGPATTVWNDMGIKIREEYWIDGEIDNPNGAAYITWNDAGEKISEEFWIKGNRKV